MEAWRIIPEFDRYSVSSDGRIRNDKSDRIMAVNKNQHGTVHVGLIRGRVQYKRSVPRLVAQAFLELPPNDRFDTPINLDGDRWDNRASNLLWRPRWFAISYHQQFLEPPRGIRRPIRDKRTGEEFPNSWIAATTYGLLDREILVATMQRTYVWPTLQRFEVIE